MFDASCFLDAHRVKHSMLLEHLSVVLIYLVNVRNELIEKKGEDFNDKNQINQRTSVTYFLSITNLPCFSSKA